MAILFAVAVFSVTAAQAQIIHVKSTTITTTKKEKPKRKLTGHYQGFVDANFGFDTFCPKGFGFDLTMTHGYRFNDFLFAGAGTGLVLQKTNEYTYCDTVYPDVALGLPVYAAVRGYMTRAAIKPFAELRLGGMIALNTVHLDDSAFWKPSFTSKLSGLYTELAIGVEYKRLFAKIDLSCRRNIQKWREIRGISNSGEFNHVCLNNRLYSTYLGFGIGYTF